MAGDVRTAEEWFDRLLLYDFFALTIKPAIVGAIEQIQREAAAKALREAADKAGGGAGWVTTAAELRAMAERAGGPGG